MFHLTSFLSLVHHLRRLAFLSCLLAFSCPVVSSKGAQAKSFLPFPSPRVVYSTSKKEIRLKGLERGGGMVALPAAQRG